MYNLRKRGVQLSLWTLVELLLIIGLIVPLFLFIDDVRNDTFFERSLLSKDLALTIGTIQSLPGKIHYTHDGKLLEKFNITFEKNDVVVAEEEKKTSYPFYVGKRFSDNYIKIFEGPSTITFTKSENTLNVEEGLGHITDLQKCLEATGDRIQEKGIVYIYAKCERSQEIGKNLAQFLSATSFLHKEMPTSEAELPILIKIEIKEEKAKSAKIYYSEHNRNSRVLSCNIHHMLDEDGSFDEIMHLPGRDVFEEREDISNYVAVSIQIGPDTSSSTLTRRINEAIEKYDESIQ